MARSVARIPVSSGFFLLAFTVVSTAHDGGERWKGTPQQRFLDSDIVVKYQCNTCHTIADRGGTVGPILNQVANRRSEEWLRHWLKDPNGIKPGTKMPTFNFPPEDYEEVVGHLSAMKRDLGVAAILSSSTSPEQKGEALFQEYDCLACHRVGARGRFIGPDLTWLGRRKSRAWERIWLKDPDGWKPGTFMPNFELLPTSIEALAAFLETLDGGHNRESQEWEFNVNFFLGNDSDRRGELVFRRFACWGCHGEDGIGGIRNPNAAPFEEMPDLREAANEYSADELRLRISSRRYPEKLSPDGEAPPFFCPDYGEALSESEFDDLYAYLRKLAPQRARFRFK